MTHLAVWGDPIEHSKSPRLHAAAYRELGLAWHYGRRQVTEAAFPGRRAELDATWRGLSLTMPLKNVAARSVGDNLDTHARLTGSVNTVLLDPAGGDRGFNTDVGGLVRALREEGVHSAPEARILGAGATATSALVAVAELGAERVEVVARRPEAAARLSEIGDELGIRVTTRTFVDDLPVHPVTVTIATLPGGADVGPGIEPWAAGGGLLCDVVYGTWPTTLAEAWQRVGAPAISGLPMLLHQALLQVRVFVNGNPSHPLEAEEDVLSAMRTAIVGD